MYVRVYTYLRFYLRRYVRMYVRMYVRIYAPMIAYVYRILDCHFISLKTSRFFMGLFHPWTSIDHPCCRIFSCLKLSSSKFQDLAVQRETPQKYKGTLEGTCPTKRLIPVTVQKGLKRLKTAAHLSKMQVDSKDKSTALTLPFKTKYRFFFCKLSISTSTATSLRKGMI